MAETKKTSGEDQSGNPVDATDLQKQLDEALKRAKDAEDQRDQANTINKELQEKLEEQEEINKDLPIVQIDKKKYKIRPGTIRLKYQGKNQAFTQEEIKEDKELQKHLLDIGSEHLQPVKSS